MHHAEWAALALGAPRPARRPAPGPRAAGPGSSVRGRGRGRAGGAPPPARRAHPSHGGLLTVALGGGRRPGHPDGPGALRLKRSAPEAGGGLDLGVHRLPGVGITKLMQVMPGGKRGTRDAAAAAGERLRLPRRGAKGRAAAPSAVAHSPPRSERPLERELELRGGGSKKGGPEKEKAKPGWDPRAWRVLAGNLVSPRRVPPPGGIAAGPALRPFLPTGPC